MPTPSVRVDPPSPIDPPAQPRDEVDPKDLKWVRHALEGQQTDHHAGAMGGGVDFVDEVMRGAETPGMGTPRTRNELPELQ